MEGGSDSSTSSPALPRVECALKCAGAVQQSEDRAVVTKEKASSDGEPSSSQTTTPTNAQCHARDDVGDLVPDEAQQVAAELGSAGEDVHPEGEEEVLSDIQPEGPPEATNHSNPQHIEATSASNLPLQPPGDVTEKHNSSDKHHDQKTAPQLSAAPAWSTIATSSMGGSDVNSEAQPMPTSSAASTQDTTHPDTAFSSAKKGRLIRVLPVFRQCVHVELTSHGMQWGRDPKCLANSIATSDLLGATIRVKPREFAVHYMLPGVKRQYKTVRFRAASAPAAAEWVHALQNTVKWVARVPLDASRICKVIINPHAGHGYGPWTWHKWSPFFSMAEIACDIEETTSGHSAFDIGQSIALDAGYECVVLVGGDGTTNEFVNGLLSRPEAEWRQFVVATPLAFLTSKGSTNALSRRVGVASHASSVHAILTRQIRPLDVLAVESPPGTTTFACDGVAAGRPGDIARDAASPTLRWMGRFWRRAYLTAKHSLCGQPLTCRLRFVERAPPSCEPDASVPIKPSDCVAGSADDAKHGRLEQPGQSGRMTKGASWNGTLARPAGAEHHRTDEGTFAVVGGWTTEPSVAARGQQPNGCMDFVAVRRGTVLGTAVATWRAARGRSHPLISRHRVVAFDVLPQGDDQTTIATTVDGTAKVTSGLVRVHVIPNLLSVLSDH